MENWCRERQCLFSFAKHHETGEPLPEDLYEKLKAAHTFRCRLTTSQRQCCWAPALLQSC